uniref:Neutral cholesterol ester hydrolase 1 n=1 Tax=Oncorhynchus mykiss TaxID=8022 RepID=A0A8C7R4P3_ONCMY
RMKLSSIVVTLILTVGVPYYIYTPLPAAIEDHLKLMLLDALFRAMLQGDLCQCLGLSHHITVIRGSTLGLGSPGEMAGGQGGGMRVSDVDFDRVPVRVYEPPAAGGGDGGLRRAVMFYHGGGWALGTTKMGSYDVLCRQMSDELNAVVVSVEYRLAPEVHFPVQYEDCLAAAKHFLEPGILGKLSVDPQRVAVSGDSAGGNLAAAVAQQISVDDSVRVKFSVQALIYPVLQGLDLNTPSYQQNHNMPMLHRSMMARFWLLYLGVDTSLHPLLLSPSFLHHPSIPPSVRSHLNWTTLLPAKHIKHYKPVGMEMGSQEVTGQEGDLLPGLLDVRAAPLLAEQGVLSRTPRAYILTCEYDVLRDDGLMYTRRLQDAGVAVSSHHYDDGFHGALSFAHWPFFFDVGERMIRGYMDWLQENL